MARHDASSSPWSFCSPCRPVPLKDGHAAAKEAETKMHNKSLRSMLPCMRAERGMSDEWPSTPPSAELLYNRAMLFPGRYMYGTVALQPLAISYQQFWHISWHLALHACARVSTFYFPVRRRCGDFGAVHMHKSKLQPGPNAGMHVNMVSYIQRARMCRGISSKLNSDSGIATRSPSSSSSISI